MNKRLVIILKLLAMVAILGVVGWKLADAWNSVQRQQFRLDWRFALLGFAAFGGTMITSALTWRWLAWRSGDRHATLPLLAAYTFSQMGKYFFKVGLLLMRIERTQRLGMEPRVCVIATLIENAMYMVSGGLVAIITLLVYLRDRPLIVAMVALGLCAILTLFHPRIFYALIDRTLLRLKYAPLAPEQRLRVPDLILAVLMFLPVWAFGGLSLWCAAHSIIPIAPHDIARMPGAYAMGVTGGMASMLPGGLGANEGMKTLFLIPVLGVQPALGAALVQRLFQLIIEVTFGLTGGWLTLRKPALQPK